MNNIKNNLIYWIPTILVAGLWTYGGISSLLKLESSMEVYSRLGYPTYFSVLLGSAQLLGVITILAPVPRTLREWAYAGLTFDVSSAIFSILATGAPISNVSIPVIALLLVLTSYLAWRSRENTIKVSVHAH